MACGGGTAVAKKASAPKKPKAALSHPPYIEMVKEALLALKERTGSSHYAIAKHIEEQQKVVLPSNFKKLLSVQLKKFVASGKLVKVKNSFKISPVEKKSSEESKPIPKAKPAPKTKEVAEKKAKTSVAKKDMPKKAAPAKAKGKTVTKPAKAVAKPVKKVKTVKVASKSPAKKVAASKVKKAVEKAKKPKSIKSPVKKAPATKRARK